MAAPGEDTYQSLKSAVDSWAAEVSEIRSALSHTMHVQLDTKRPAFRLSRARIVPLPAEPKPAAIAPVVPEVAPQDHYQEQARTHRAAEEQARLEHELEFVREQLHARNREAIESQETADAKAEHLEEMARALGRTRIELDEVVQQLRAKEWALLQISSDNESLRRANEGQLPARTVMVDDYDALADSHMGLREDVRDLQQRLVQRDHEVIALRDQLSGAHEELAMWESSGPMSAAGISKLAGVLADRSAALEEIEDTALGQKLLIGALRQELDSVRNALDHKELDHDRLAQALRTELECLRLLSSERDFVISHQAETITTTAHREGELSAELAEARELCESLRRRSEQAIEERETLGREIQLLRAKLAERESEVWKLRAAPAAPAPVAPAPGLTQLQAALAARDAELDRARERIEFLRSLTRETPPAPVASPPPISIFPASAVPPVAPPAPVVDETPLSLDYMQMNAALQKEVEDSLSLGFPWPMIGLVGGLAGIGLLALGLFALFLA